MKYALQNIFNNFYVNDWPQLKKKLLLSAKERQKKSNSRILRSAPDYIFLHIRAVGTKLISAERRKIACWSSITWFIWVSDTEIFKYVKMGYLSC